MDYVKLGSTGLDVSPLALGAMSYGDPARGTHEWSLPEEESRDYIRRSIVNPNAEIVAGFQAIMPGYEGRLNEEQMLDLIAYVRTMGGKP